MVLCALGAGVKVNVSVFGVVTGKMELRSQNRKGMELQS
jgi:hypothetical protein